MKNLTNRTTHSPDRRVEKTRGQLHDALMSLLHEKSYAEIAVKEILDRANVGRSTFYMHFGDKDELLASGIADVLAAIRAAKLPPSANRVERVVGFGLPVFEHIAEQRAKHRRAGKARLGDHGRAVHHEYLQKALVEMISTQMTCDSETRRHEPRQVPAELLARHVASTFILVLNWWIEQRNTFTPVQADALFRALVVPAL